MYSGLVNCHFKKSEGIDHTKPDWVLTVSHVLFLQQCWILKFVYFLPLLQGLDSFLHMLLIVCEGLLLLPLGVQTRSQPQGGSVCEWGTWRVGGSYVGLGASSDRILSWHCAVLPWEKDVTGKVKLFLLLSSVCPVLDFILFYFLLRKFSAVLPDFHKGTVVHGDCQHQCSLGGRW